MSRWALLVLTIAACAREREQAPRSLDELTHAVYRSFEDPVDPDDLTDLEEWVLAEGSSEAAWDGLRLTNLVPEDVVGIDIPEGTDLTAHVGMATARLSPFSAAAHAALIIEADQRWTDPKTFERYEREILEGDTDAFSAGDDDIRTLNRIEKSGSFGVLIPYELRKDYSWYTLESGARVLLSRNWVSEPGCTENGKNCVLQAFGLDSFWEIDEDTSVRLFTNWLLVTTEVDSLISEEARIGLIANGNQDIFEATDAELERRAGE